MAQARGIRVEAKTYDAAPLLAAVVRTPAAAQRACVLEALAAVEAGPASAQAAARAWAWGPKWLRSWTGPGPASIFGPGPGPGPNMSSDE